MTTSGIQRNPRRITLSDVARQAQVSRALVSIVMRDAPGASAVTRERVRAIARELGYRPDVRARSLASQKSRLIGVMFGVDVGVFHFDLLDGLYAAAEAHGHNLILTALTRNRDELHATQSLHDFRFDALVMLGPPTPVPVLAGEVPVVVVGWQVDHPAVDVVRTSDTHGMTLALDHLTALGHRRITHIDGGDGLISASRTAAYQRAMAASELGEHVHVVRGGQTQLDGQRAARALLEEGDLPTAVVAYNDDTAVGAVGFLTRQGIDIPRQLSITGWDDSEAAALSPVGLTSVAQNPSEMARLAIERMIARTDSRRVEYTEIVLDPHLVLRESTTEIFSS